MNLDDEIKKSKKHLEHIVFNNPDKIYFIAESKMKKPRFGYKITKMIPYFAMGIVFVACMVFNYIAPIKVVNDSGSSMGSNTEVSNIDSNEETGSTSAIDVRIPLVGMYSIGDCSLDEGLSNSGMIISDYYIYVNMLENENNFKILTENLAVNDTFFETNKIIYTGVLINSGLEIETDYSYFNGEIKIYMHLNINRDEFKEETQYLNIISLDKNVDIMSVNYLFIFNY